jgi:hypothetical protein
MPPRETLSAMPTARGAVSACAETPSEKLYKPAYPFKLALVENRQYEPRHVIFRTVESI